MRRNEFDQPIGDAVEWTPRPAVAPVSLVGEHCRLDPWRHDQADALHDAAVRRSPASNWTYLRTPPLDEPSGIVAWMDATAADPSSVPLVISTPEGRPVGTASYLRIDPANGSVEVGSIAYSADLQRTTAATEAMYLMMRHAFDDLGYRRYEWKCDALNEPSRAAAERLGFVFEGVFRNAMVYKGRNRDTAWFSVTDAEWPRVRAAFGAWLAPENFGADGAQIAPLQARVG